MPSYVVILERRFHGSACGSTNDVVHASSEAEAIEHAIAEWRKVEPSFTFARLFSGPCVEQCRGCGARFLYDAATAGDYCQACVGERASAIDILVGRGDPQQDAPII